MNIFRSIISRRKFLSISSMALLSPWLTKAFHPVSPVSSALASDKPAVPETQNEHEDWLKLTKEEAIEPKLPICDPHHHLWHGYLLKDFLNDISGGHNILKTVYVEAWGRNQDVGLVKMTPVEETAFAVTESTSIKSRTDVTAAIVGYADLTSGEELVPLLEAHIEAGKGRFRGIRAAGHGSFKADSKYREGCENLRRFGLSLDAYVRYTDFKELADLARSFPDMPIIVNHIGNPAGIGAGDEKSKEIMQNWKDSIKTLAVCQNVYFKLGGLGMTSFGFGWNKLPAPPGSIEIAKKMAPCLNHCIEQFGTGRCMFESNFPVDKESYSYTILWNAFKRVTKDFSDAERSALFHDTAVKAYRLKK